MKAAIVGSVVVVVMMMFVAGTNARRHGVSREYEFEQQQQRWTTATTTTERDVDPPVQLYEQRLDHFTATDQRTWQQRYQVDASLWGGKDYPIFVMLGGEGPMGSKTLSNKYVLNEWGTKARALLVSIEHRFYGESIPGDGTLGLSNMRYLTTEQALADYAVIIQAVRAQYHADAAARVVTFGGSYSGSLSAWMRQKYPNVVYAALASSAPVLAQVDFPEYLQVVTDSVGSACSAKLKTAFVQIETMLGTSSGKTMLETDFATCTKLGGASEKDEVTFLESLTDTIAGVVQYSGDNNARGRIANISWMCGIITDPAFSTAYSAFAAFAQSYRTLVGDNCTESSYQNQLDELRNPDPKADGAAGRSWTWQTCVEYGYYQTGSEATPFSKRINLKYYTDLCADVYGVKPASMIDRAVTYTNLWLGGRNIGSSRIVLANGSVDPWHALGMTSTVDPLMPVFYIKGTAHCADLYASSSADLPSLTTARNGAWTFISTWLAQK